MSEADHSETMDKGFLVGDDEGRLGLTMDDIRIFVAHDRAGLYD